MTAAEAAGRSDESGEGPMTIIAERASVITNEATLRPPTPAAPPPGWPTAERRSRRAAVWYAVFAVYAGGVAVFSGPGHDRSWGIWASFGCSRAKAYPRVSRTGTVLAVGIAAMQSYSHIYDLARAPGQSPIDARLLPLSVDGLIIAASLGCRAPQPQGRGTRADREPRRADPAQDRPLRGRCQCQDAPARGSCHAPAAAGCARGPGAAHLLR
jgi:hypothetical protein